MTIAIPTPEQVIQNARALQPALRERARQAQLDRKVASGTVTAEHLREFAATLADFHAHLEPTPAGTGFGGAPIIIRAALSNLRDLADAIDDRDVEALGAIGSWTIMIPAKFSEGKLEDQVPMRLTLLLLGALVGFVAWFLAQALLLSPVNWGDPISIDKGFLSNELLRWPKPGTDMNASLAYYIAYFAFLFLLPRWWRVEDSRLPL